MSSAISPALLCISKTEKGVASGVATLDEFGTVPTEQLYAVGNCYIASGSYTGDGTLNRAIPHGLGLKPLFVWIGCLVAGTGFFTTFYNDTTLVDVMGNGAAPVTALSDTNIYISGDSNTEEILYNWVAFG
jgi:hypothetical protein